MYFHWSREKLSTILGITCVLFVSVYVTFAAKGLFYGESSFVQILDRLATGTYKSVVYGFRTTATGPQSASAALGFSGVPQDADVAASAVPALTYHAIVEDSGEPASPESFEGHNVSLSAFEDQMFALKEAGWETITLDDFIAFVRGERELPARSFLLTFDDGSKESFYPVDPVLRALDYEAVSFVLPALSQGRGTFYYLSETEIDRMLDSGRWEIGSHGEGIHSFVPVDAAGTEGAALANRQWSYVWGGLESLDAYTTRIRADLTESRRTLEDMTGRPIHAFAYPFGEFGQLSKNVPEAESLIADVVDATYEVAFYQRWPGEGYSYNYPSDATRMRRISVQPTWSGVDLLTLLERGLPKPLPYTDPFDVDRGWYSTWGDYRVEDGTLVLAAAPESSGASVILDGSGHWEDYTVHMELSSPAQTGVSVWVRFQDNENNAICNFGNGFAHVEQTVDGEHRVIMGARDPNTRIPAGRFSIDITVEGRTVTCVLNETVSVTTDFLERPLDRGGIGIKVWDPELGTSSVRIDELSVTELGATP